MKRCSELNSSILGSTNFHHSRGSADILEPDPQLLETLRYECLDRNCRSVDYTGIFYLQMHTKSMYLIIYHSRIL